MNIKQIGRVLVCLLLVSCLIVQTVPVKTEATGAGLAGVIASASSVTVSAPLAVGASLIALGVMANNTNPLVFENVVNYAVDSLSAAGQWVVDGTVELLRTVDEAGNAMYYAAGDMLETIRLGLFSSGLIDQIAYGSQFTVSGSVVGAATFTCDVPFAMAWDTCGSGASWWFFSNQPGTVYYESVSGSRGSLIMSASSVVSGLYVTGWISYYGDTSAWDIPFLGHHNNSSCNPFVKHYSWVDPLLSLLVGSTTTSHDLSLGQISSVPVDGSSALDWAPEYQAKRLKVIEGGNDPDPDSDPPNDGKWFWPLALTVTTAELFAMSQADQWSGVTPPEFSEYSSSADYEIVSRPEIDGYQGLEIKPVTNPNPGTGTNPDPDIGGDAGDNTGSDTGDQIDYTSWFRRIVELIEELLDRFKAWVTDCKTAIEELPSKFAKWFDNICETLSNIWEWCQNLVGSLIDALRNLLSSLFSPAPDFIANKVNSLTAKYPYLDTFTGLGSSLKSFFLNLGSKPPIIYIDLSAATGSYFFGGRQAFIDLTWYSDYKPTMDAILGAFIWLWLAWRVFHALPGIINGMSGTVGERVSYSGTQNINLPPLPPQNELPPGYNRRM